MGQQNVVYTYHEIIFSLKKEGNSGMSYNTDKPWGYYAESNKPVKKNYCMILLGWGIQSSRNHKTESWMVVARSWGREEMGVIV